MKKEVVLAVTVGFVLGLIITFGVWTANKNLKPLITQNQNQPTPTPNQINAPTPALSQISISITSPENEFVTTDKNLTLTGLTQPELPVFITTETNQTVVVADTTGKFSYDISLEGGYNRLTASVFDSSGNSASKEIIVTYTTSKI